MSIPPFSPTRPRAVRPAVLGALLPAAALAALLPARAAAQTVFEACYVPHSGTIYRIKAPNTPAACERPSHVAFRWTDAAGGSGAVAARGAMSASLVDDPTYLLTNGVRTSANGFAVVSPSSLAAAPVLPSTPTNSYALLWHGPRGALRVGKSTGLGWSADSLGGGSFAYGTNSVASGVWSMAGGSSARAAGNSSVALGSGATAETNFDMSFGRDARARGGSALALGTNALAQGAASVAIGSGAIAWEPWDHALGRQASATGGHALALGAWANAGGSGSVAISGALNGGQWAKAQGTQSVAIGHAVTALRERGVVIGNNASTGNHAGAFVLNTHAEATLTAGAPEQFVARFVGGYRLFTNSANSTGCAIAAGGGSWSCTSDRATKTAFAPLDGDALLAKLRRLSIGTWEYRTERGARHLGPVAQDFRAAFGLGGDARSIAVLDASGVALAAARALEARTRALQAENAALRRRHDEVSERVARLEQALATLAAAHDQRR